MFNYNWTECSNSKNEQNVQKFIQMNKLVKSSYKWTECSKVHLNELNVQKPQNHPETAIPRTVWWRLKIQLGIYLSHNIESIRITSKESMHCNGSSSELQKHVFTLIWFLIKVQIDLMRLHSNLVLHSTFEIDRAEGKLGNYFVI